MKKKFNKFKKIILNNKENSIIILISLLTLIIGSLAFKFIWAFLIVVIIDLILFLPNIIKNIKKGPKKGTPIKKKSSSNNKKKNSSANKKIGKIIMIIFLVVAILTLIAGSLFMFIVVKSAPKFSAENLYQAEASILYDANGKVIDKIGSEIREKISFDDLPEVLVDAVIATEDSRFFQHNGFDLPRFLKASFGQALGQDAGGASTLTMQLSKNHFTSTEARGIKGVIRKFTDIYIAIFQIEKKYTKKEIIEFYVNSNNLGARQYGGAYGVEQASQIYFGKKAKDLTLPEAALIAGLFQAPNGYDPYIHPDKALARRNNVLYLMERHGYITEEEQKIAQAVTIDDMLVVHDSYDKEYQGFINTVVDEVQNILDIDPYTTSLEIYTTINLEQQDYLNKIINGETFKWENEVVQSGISIIDVKTGAISAIGTGRNNVGAKTYNLATDIKRQIGSTAKPLYDYAPGVEFNNWSTYHPFIDEPHGYTVGGGAIQNWDMKFQGMITLREALKTSRNIPALKAFQSVDRKKIGEFATSLGLSPEYENGNLHEAHSLGGYNGESPLSLSVAYAAFANGGFYVEPHSFTKVVIRDTKEIIERKPKKTKVMSPSTAYIMNNVLIDTAAWSMYGNHNVNGVKYAAKTGTTNFTPDIIKKYGLPANAINDVWVAGYNPDYAIALWYGYDKINKDYVTRFGNAEFRRLFQEVAKGVWKKNKEFTKPNDVIEVAIEKETSPALLPSEFTPKNMIITEVFKKGTEPTEVSKRYEKLDNPTNLKLDNQGNKIKLTWDPIKLPSGIDTDAITKKINSLYKEGSVRNNALSSRINYNNSHIGDIGYNIYLKTNDKLQLLGFTINNYYEHTPTSSGSNTYVVKSAYSIFKDNMSDGSEATIAVEGSTSNISSILVGDGTITYNVGDKYEKINPGVSVTDNIDEVTHLATITEVIKKESTGEEVSSIETSITENYTITYTVKYKNYTKVHTRKIIIK